MDGIQAVLEANWQTLLHIWEIISNKKYPTYYELIRRSDFIHKYIK